jgi:translation initiation factor IF-2
LAAIRIYALAKELQLDNKDLVDLLPKAGITGKGSALASLTDEEVVKLKEFLGKRNRPAERPVAERPLDRMERPAPTERVIKNLDRPRPAAKLIPADSSDSDLAETEDDGNSPAIEPAPAEVSVTETAAPPAIAATATALEKPAVAPKDKPTPAAVQRSSPLGARIHRPPTGSTTAALMASPDSGPLRRDDYLGPSGAAARKPLDLSSARNRTAGDDGKEKRKLEQRQPNIRVSPINLAPMTPVKPVKSNEPAPQKPDMKLPMDVIRQTKTGAAKPLQEHMKTIVQKQADAAKAKLRSPGATTPDAGAAGRGKRGVGKAAGEELGKSLGGRDARTLNRKRHGPARKPGDEESPLNLRSRTPSRYRIKRTGKGSTALPRKSKVVVDLPCTLRAFSEAVGISAAQVLMKLMGMGMSMTITSTLDQETAEMLALEMGVELELRQEPDAEEELLKEADAPDDEATLVTRPPVITFLGHVDHGKTSLLDRIIGIDVAKGESGGITQHIRAYQIERNGKKISFVDTPGHEAFTEMRARGANVTDIAVIVVAGDDGVMPQTEEAISHAKAAGVPIIVALNKIDLPGVNIEHIYQQLATAELLPTEWGGEVEVVKTSATTGVGIDDLIETLFTIAELNDLKANPNRMAVGTCLESSMHGDRGVMAKVIVQKGTLKVGDPIVCGAASGFVKAMYDTLDTRKRIEEAGPSTPVNITGLDQAPGAGEHFYVVPDIMFAREVAAKREVRNRAVILGDPTRAVTLENLLERLDKNQAATLNVIIRSDTRGSIEAILKELTKLDHPEVKIKVLMATVGGVTEGDIHLADASQAIVLAFNVVPDEKARSLAENRGVQIRRYEIIYKLSEDLKSALEGMLKPEQREMELGRALVQRTFVISRTGTIAGCRVLSGTIARNSRLRVIRESRIIGDYAIEALRREKDDAREVREGLECGIKLAGFNNIKEGDILEAYRVEEFARTL